VPSGLDADPLEGVDFGSGEVGPDAP
jgi:hypothetical protein